MNTTDIISLGKTSICSPLLNSSGKSHQSFQEDTDRILVHIHASEVEQGFREKRPLSTFELAGPRKKIYFDPSKLRCALVTCGGLCPGLNDIIRSIVMALYYHYGVRTTHGMRYGLQGFIPKYGHEVIDLTPDPLFFPDPRPLDDTYDFITCTETIEHFHRPAEEFVRFDQMLRPGGWLALMTCFQTDDESFAEWYYRRDPTHVVFYRDATLRYIARQFGWTCEIPVKDVALMQKPSGQDRLSEVISRA